MLLQGFDIRDLLFVCRICDSGFKTEEDMNVHTTNLHNVVFEQNYIKCIRCGEKFESTEGMENHLQLGHDLDFDSDLKERTFRMIYKSGLPETLDCIFKKKKLV